LYWFTASLLYFLLAASTFFISLSSVDVAISFNKSSCDFTKMFSSSKIAFFQLGLCQSRNCCKEITSQVGLSTEILLRVCPYLSGNHSKASLTFQISQANISLIFSLVHCNQNSAHQLGISFR